MESTTSAADALRGQEWKEAELVRTYVTRMDSQASQRAESLTVMAGLLPFDLDHPVRILDIGSGHGAIAQALLDVFPNSTAVGLDMSDAMMEVGRERMSAYGDRFRYHLGDFSQGTLPSDLPGPFDAVVASKSIHHLPTENKRLLYREIYRVVAPGGCVFNLDTNWADDDFLKSMYRNASALLRGRPRDPMDELVVPTLEEGHWYESVDVTLGLLRDAGFSPVDVFWKQLTNNLIGGYKRA
jgi:tRNA (cmo5U34)-methyltransferase